MDAGAVGQIPWDAFNSNLRESTGWVCREGYVERDPPDACDAEAGAQCALYLPSIHCALAALLGLKCVDRQQWQQTRALEVQ